MRALAAVLVLWAAGRSAALWSEWRAVPKEALAAAESAGSPDGDPVFIAQASGPRASPVDVMDFTARVRRLRVFQNHAPATLRLRVDTHFHPMTPLLAAANTPALPAATVPDIPLTPRLLSGSTAQPRRRSPRLALSGSAWALGRGGEGPGSGGTLGGAQVGTRLYLGPSSGVAATARFSAALKQPGREAALGVAWRHGPLVLLVERRFSLDRAGRNDFSLTAAGGGKRQIAGGRSVEGYAQIGVVGRDGFADAAVRTEQQLKRGVAIGLGAWGAAQPRLRRVDVGPLITLRTQRGGGSMRLAAEWRIRIAGNASPASGPTLSLGADF